MTYTGNMSALLIAEYRISQMKEKGLLPADGMFITTIVSSELAKAIAKNYGLECIEVLTGFKNIGAVIKKAEEVPDRFHSRYNCKQKTYRYVINNSETDSAIYRNLEYNIKMPLDVNKMQEAANYFVGEHDFAGFKASGTSSKSSVRTIYSAKVIKNNERIAIELTGNGFLYNMVRIIAGTLVEVGLGKIKPEAITGIIESKDRQKAGKTLPPYGLYLVEVNYN